MGGIVALPITHGQNNVMARLKRRWRVDRWHVAFCIASCAYFASVLVHVTFYSQRLTATLQCGFIGLYWGGSSDVRNGWVHNWFSGPWDGSGAGADAPEGLDYYFTTLDVFRSISRTEWRYILGGFHPRWGTNPRISAAYSFEELIVPCWMPVAALGAVVACLFWRHSRAIPPHCCQNCGYDLTGNTSGTCPECGGKMGIAQ